MQKLTFLLIILLALCRAQTPAADPQRAALEGHIVSLTGEPIKKVTVRLQQTGSAPGGTLSVAGNFSAQIMPTRSPSKPMPRVILFLRMSIPAATHFPPTGPDMSARPTAPPEEAEY